MQISFAPQRRDGTLDVVTDGDTLTINGDVLDLSALPDGSTLPAGAVACAWIVGPVARIGGVLHLTLLLPHGPDPSPAVAYPEPIIVTEDGPVPVPRDPDPAGEDGEGETDD